MKVASFTLDGQARYGVVEGDQYRLPPEDFLQRHPDLAAVLAAGALDELGRVASRSVPVSATKALPVIPRPGKFICVGLNYKSHVAEMNRSDSEFPALFVRFTDSLAAQGDPVPKPGFISTFDWEGELAIVIGQGGRNIPQAEAFEHIAGYCCFNDVSVREFQRHTHQWTPGKNFPGTGPLGPHLVTRDEVPDVTKLTLETRVNGEVMQHASVADLIYTIPVVIEYVSRFTPLSPGDVIATGTPSGVGSGRKPPVYMKPGDVVEVEITGLGVLRNPIVAA